MSHPQVDFHVRHWGHGTRRAILIHCSLAHSGAWSGLAERLDGALDMAAFDLPGHGRGPDWDRATDAHDISTRMAAELAGQGPVDLIGHSFGATVALRLAIERPELVRSLTMIEPVFFAAARLAGDPAFDDYMAETAPFEEAWQRGERETATRHFLEMWGMGTAWEDMPPAQRAYVTERIDFVSRTASVLSEDSLGLLAPGRLEGVRTPSLIVTGAESPSVMPAIARALAARLPDVRLCEVPGAAHMVPISDPDAVARAIRVLLDASSHPVSAAAR